jgi:GNAT superfamily N-acetyltransferase
MRSHESTATAPRTTSDWHRTRRGVATALVETAEAWGRERGATVALCDTWTESPVSLPFWEEHMRYEGRSLRLRKRLTS